MKSKYIFKSTRSDYMTPLWCVKLAAAHFGITQFDLDVCCTLKNIPAKHHYVNGEIDG